MAYFTEISVCPTNQLLAALPAAEYERLLPHLHPVSLPLGQVLHQPREMIQRVYFLNDGMVSLVLTSLEGMEVEVAIVGREGMVGVTALLTSGPTTMASAVQIEGSGFWMPTGVLLEESRRGGALQGLLHGYLHGLLCQIAQATLCNRLHTPPERLSRWLLLISDQVQSEEFDLSEELLGTLLGAHHPTAALAARTLRQTGLIDYHRGHITIVDREGLQDCACECYGVIREQMERVPGGR